MATRHQVRQSVISLLYANEMGSEMSEFSDEYLEDRKIRNKQKDFTNSLLNGVLEHIEELDSALNENLSEYKINEVSPIDRAILRLGAYEICFTDTDNAVIINEAIELAKEMSSETSPKFVNGVLDSLAKHR